MVVAPVPAISIQQLTRRFGDLTAVDGISLDVMTHESFGLLGPNGAGKSTLIKMLTTLLPPTGGTAVVAGHDIRKSPGGVRRAIGYVPQLLSADGTLTGYENLLIFAKLYDIPAREREGRVRQAIEYMGLTEFAGSAVRKYSGGMIRRLEIAQSMLHRPEILFLDEPTVGLDPGARRAVWQYIRRLQEDYGTTVLLTTHLMDEADQLCDRLAIMNRGSIVAQGTPTELRVSTLGDPDSSLDDVFIKLTGGTIDEADGATYRDVRRTRKTARRLG
jgi:ABC-2 type transport system ATP-binding protein